MATAQARHGLRFPFRTLEKPLTSGERRKIARFTRQLLGWSDRLGTFPRAPAGLPSATPFVSIYAEGVLRGCYGSNEGLVRAVLGALHDLRFGPIAPAERRTLTAEVTYAFPPRRLAVGELEHQIELGTEGVCVTGVHGPTLFLPNVARDESLDAPGLLAALAKKAGTSSLETGHAWLFSADSVVVQRGSEHAAVRESAASAAARWLSARVARNGAVEFGCDPRWRKRHERGPFLHARSAIVIAALARSGARPKLTARAREWLESELARAARRKRVPDFPERISEIAGTFALAKLAGVEVRAELDALSREASASDDAWYAAQLVLALGPTAPRACWQRCVRDLDRHPWAPWTAMAARALGDAETLERTERALVDSLSRSSPYLGAARVRPVPELALTAVAIEALAPSKGRAARAAVDLGKQFLLRHQLRRGGIPAAFEPALADGAFPLSVVVPALRSDVTAHALLALLR